MGAFDAIRSFFRNNILAKPIDDDLFFSLNVYDKLRHYRRVPIKLIINVIVCAALTAYAMQYQLFVSDYAVRSRYAVAITMIEPDDETDAAFDKQIANIGEFKDFVEGFVEGYYVLPMSSLGVFMHFTRSLEESAPQPVQLWLRYATDKSFSQFEERTFDLTDDDPLGPFANVTMLFPQTETCIPELDSNNNAIIPCRNDTLADFFDVLQSVKLRAQLRGVECNPAFTFASMLKWDVETTFGFSAHNSILRAKTDISFQETQRLRTEPIIFALALLVISLWGLVLRLYFFLRHFDYASKALSPALLRRYRETVSWHYFGILANMMTMVFCIVTLASAFLSFIDYNLVQWRSVVLGFAVFFEFILLLSHFQNVPRMYVIAQSITTALPLLSTYFVSIFPIFFGFALASSSALGGVSEIFDSLPDAMISLFCMICGDSLIDIFTMSNTTNFTWLQGFNSLILALFVFIFIPNILNIALSLVQDSYAWVTETHDVEERIHKRIQRAQQRVSTMQDLNGGGGGGGGGASGGGGGDGKGGAQKRHTAHSLAAAVSAIKGGLMTNDAAASGRTRGAVGISGGLTGASGFVFVTSGRNAQGTRPPVDPFDEAELEELRRRFTIHRADDSSSNSDDDDAERDEYERLMHEREELHFHRRRFHHGDTTNARSNNNNTNNNNDGSNSPLMPSYSLPGSAPRRFLESYSDPTGLLNGDGAPSSAYYATVLRSPPPQQHQPETPVRQQSSGWYSNSQATTPAQSSRSVSFTHNNNKRGAGGRHSGQQ